MEAQFYSTSIEIKDLFREKMNFRVLDDGTEILVLFDMDIHKRWRVFSNICPHMGGPLSAGKFNPDSQTLQCPWHGYLFGVGNCELKTNPHQKTLLPFANLYKTYRPEKSPRYRMREFSYEIKDARIYIQKKRGREI